MDEGISKLPAPMLHHILSFLYPEEAVQTCVVSKSWRHLVSTRPKFSLSHFYFEGDKEKFRNVLDKSLQVYYDQKLSIDDFGVSCESMDDPELVSLLKKWIPIVTHDLGVKKFELSFGPLNSEYFDLPPAMVFESESLQELYLHKCKLSEINCFGKNNHLKTLHLDDVHFEEEESFAKLMSSCPLIERLTLDDCKGLTTIKMHYTHNLKAITLCNHKIYLSSTVGYNCSNSLITCLRLQCVALSNEWFDSFSRNFPCLEDLHLYFCSGFDELKLSSPSIKKLHITLNKYTTKTTIDAPNIKKFVYEANISQSAISFKPTSSEWKSEIRLDLNENVSQWFLKISELVAALSQSQINSLVLSEYELSVFGLGKQHDFEHLSDIPICRGSHEMPVAIGSLELVLGGHYYESFFSDLVNGLFRIFRPREIKQSLQVDKNAQDEENQNKRNEVNAKEEKHHAAAVELMCKILFTGKSVDQEMFCWQRADLEEISLQVFDKECHLVQGTISCSEYVAALLKKPGSYVLRIRLKWSGGK